MWNYSFVLPDFIILFLFVVYFFSQPRLSNKLNKSFFNILVVDFLVITIDVIASMSLENAERFSPFYLRCMNVLYFLFFNLRIFLFFLFTENCIGLRISRSKLHGIFRSLIFILAELLAFANLFTDVLFSISENGSYARGPCYNSIYICAAYYIAVSLIELFFYRKDLLYGSAINAFSYNLALIFGFIARFFFPQFLIMNLFTLAAITIIYLTYENPAVYLAGKTNAFNKKALTLLLDEFKNEKKPLLIGFVIHNYNELREIYSGIQMDKGIVLICQYLAKNYPRLNRFYLHDGRFILIGKDNSQTERICREIMERFNQAWQAGSDVDLYLEAGFVQLGAGMRIENSEQILNGLISAFKELSTLEKKEVVIDAETFNAINQNTLIKRAVEYAVEQNAVEMFLQPLTDAKTHKLIGAEALARIRDDKGELIPPVQFIPIAEKNGRINQLGEQMFEKACQFIHDNDMEKLGIQWINVNLSPIQFLRRDLNQRFSEILKKYQVNAELIHLEITEESMIDYTLLHKQIQTMKATGFQFVLDDYGSGYSNVSRLKRCPFINVKLDMELVWDYFKDQDKILPTLVQTFKQMNLTVTAEGVETLEMADSMRDMGCNYLQGYYFSKPLSVAEFLQKYDREN